MSSTTQKKKNKGGKQEAVEQINSSAAADKSQPGDDGVHPFERELSKKLRNYRKKLVQISDLLQKQKNKEIVLNDEQKEKVSGKQELEEEIKDAEEYLKTFRESQAGELKRVQEAERQHQKELKKARENAVAGIANMLTLHNLRERGVEIDDKFDAGVGVYSDTLKALLAPQGELQWRQERDCFNKYWTSLVSRSKDIVPDQDISYEDLADGIADLISSGNFPEKIPGKKAAAEAPAEPTAVPEPPKEEPKKKKEPKPLPADYIYKAGAVKEVAEEDKVEEVVGGGMDADFLDGFDAFDEDDDDVPAPPKAEASKVEAPAEEAKTAGGDKAGDGAAEAEGGASPDADDKRGRGRGRGNRPRGRWEDGENRGGGRGRGARGGRGRGGKQDDEGFETVVEGQKRGGRGRGDRGGRGRGRGDRGRGMDRPQTAGGDGFRGDRGRGGERGARGVRPQTSKMKSNQMDGEEAKAPAAEQTKGEEKKE